MKVIVCTFTEHDINMLGRTFYTLEDAKTILAEELKHITEVGDVDQYISQGLIALRETAIEGGGKPLELIMEFTEGEHGGTGGVQLRDDQGVELFGVSEGEPEDMTMGRDLSDCLNVENLVTIGYEAAQQGRELNIEYIGGDEE